MSDDEDLPLAVALTDEPAASAPVTSTTSTNPGNHGPVPVTLITGFLGSGKTTLVKYILEERHGFRIAVILNEYGSETGLESAFVQSSEGSRSNVPEWVELANGCLCCSVKAEFVQALEGLLAADSSYSGKFDYILVETTGLANPGPIMAELWTDEELEAAVVLDGVVTVVDGRNVGHQLSETRLPSTANEAQLQVALADIILLNKIDLLGPQQVAAVRSQLQSINAAAQIITTTFSRVDLAQILNRGAYHLRLQQQQQQHLRWLADVSAAALSGDADAQQQQQQVVSCSAVGCQDPAHRHGKAPTSAAAAAAAAAAVHAQACSAHDAAVKTVSLKTTKPLDLQRFRAWVEALLWERQPSGNRHISAPNPDPAAAAAGSIEHEADMAAGQASGAAAAAAAALEGSGPAGAEVLRMKGLLDVSGSESVHMFQAVYDLYDLVEGATWQQLIQQQQQQQQRLSRLVVIGRFLDAAALQAGLEACCAAAAAQK